MHTVIVNGTTIDNSAYEAFHARRFDETFRLIEGLGGGAVIELGGHPWAMTTRILRDPTLNLVATVSAEEVSQWPDEIPVSRQTYHLEADGATSRAFTNYSANVERTLFDIDEPADIVFACEIAEHLTRAPHIMFLNANRWLKTGGHLIVTTPNGAQFSNPFRNKSKSPPLRASTYARHNYLFTLEGLVDLVSTCGFEIVKTERASPYPRRGLASAYLALGRAPNNLMRRLFTQSLHVVARKISDADQAARLPKIYAPSPDWERVAAR